MLVYWTWTLGAGCIWSALGAAIGWAPSHMSSSTQPSMPSKSKLSTLHGARASDAIRWSWSPLATSSSGKPSAFRLSSVASSAASMEPSSSSSVMRFNASDHCWSGRGPPCRTLASLFFNLPSSPLAWFRCVCSARFSGGRAQYFWITPSLDTHTAGPPHTAGRDPMELVFLGWFFFSIF
jgi:hypothetical protein